MKVKNIFICHRPYHVIVAASIISIIKQLSNETVNVGYLFDVVKFIFSREKRKFQYYSCANIFKCDKIFDRILCIPRDNEVRIWNIVKFFIYYHTTVKKFTKLIKAEKKISNVFIFSDKEKPIEILASISKSLYKTRIILIDEGVVSHFLNKNNIKDKVKKYLVKILNLKYISSTIKYGHSNIIDYHLSFDPQNTHFNNINIIKMPIINIDKLKAIIKIDIPSIKRKTVLYISNALSEGNVMKYDREIQKVKEICMHLYELGFNTIIKPHPVEIVGKFNTLKKFDYIEIFNDEFLPAEIFFNEKNIHIICGITSSALLNSARLGKSTISLLHLFGIYDNSLENILKKYTVAIPNNFTELSYAIKNRKYKEDKHLDDSLGINEFIRKICLENQY